MCARDEPICLLTEANGSGFTDLCQFLQSKKMATSSRKRRSRKSRKQVYSNIWEIIVFFNFYFATQAAGEAGDEDEDEEGHYSNLLGDEEGKEDIR